mmetsp:Transcript_10438/g.22416  ORF Transcript_10438/g.22416 Transcript_10438/m.22416 type:complete len:440 (-) Transcript_10438:77-1396(-)
MKQEGISTQSHRSNNEESQSELLSTRGLGFPAQHAPSRSHDDFTRLIVTPALNHGNKIANFLLLRRLIVIRLIILHPIDKSVNLLALPRRLVKVLAHLRHFDLLRLVPVPAVVLIDLRTRRDAIVIGKRLLEQMIRELDVVPVVVLDVLIRIDRSIVQRALLVREQCDFDAGPGAGAHGPGVVHLAGVFVLVDFLAVDVFGGVDVAVHFHVFDVFAFVVAGVAVQVVVGEVATTTSGGGVVAVIVISVGGAFFACLAVLLLLLLFEAKGRLEVGIHVDDVFSVIGIAAGARVLGAEAEDDESFCGEDGIFSVIVVVVVVVVSVDAGILFDQLALLEFDGISRNVDIRFFFEATELGFRRGTGAAHQAADVVGLGGVLGGLGSEGVGGGGGGQEGGEGGGDDLHGWMIKNSLDINNLESVPYNNFNIGPWVSVAWPKARR